MSSQTAFRVSMYMRSHSSSRNKPHSFLASLDVHGSIIFKYSRRDQAFRLTVWDHPVLPSQSVVISIQLGSARPVGSCQKFPWHGTRKNVMCKNGPLFQHCFFYDKSFFDNESLQIHKHWTMMSNSSRIFVFHLAFLSFQSSKYLLTLQFICIILRTTLNNGQNSITRSCMMK